jgi:hypothetical protein
MFSKLEHVVGVFYLAVDIFEDLARAECGVSDSTVGEDLEYLLAHVSSSSNALSKTFANTSQYMKVDGSGVTIAELVDALKESRDFLLEQFRKKMSTEYWVGGYRGLIWTDSNFYRWVVAKCPMVILLCSL